MSNPARRVRNLVWVQVALLCAQSALLGLHLRDLGWTAVAIAANGAALCITLCGAARLYLALQELRRHGYDPDATP